jgi:hypothetical protein
LGRVICISLKRIIFLLVLVIVVTAGFFWAIDRTNTHKVWASMLRESQRFMIHLDEVYVLLPAKFQGESIPTHYHWFLAELSVTPKSRWMS